MQEVAGEIHHQTETNPEEEEGGLATRDQVSEQLEEEMTVINLTKTKEEEENEEDVVKTSEEEQETGNRNQETQQDPEETTVVKRPMINQENCDHQYSSGDYKHQAKEVAEEEQQEEEEEEPEEEEEEEEAEERVVHRDNDALYALSPHTQGSEPEMSLREEKICTPMTEEDEDEEELEEEEEQEEERQEQDNRHEKEEGELMIEEDEDDQDSIKASPATVVIEVRSEEEDDEDDDEEEEEEDEDGVEQDRVSEGSGITDDSENWDMSRGNLGLLEKAIALKAEEVKGGQEVQSSPEYHPYSSSSKGSQGAGTARRTAYYSKGESF